MVTWAEALTDRNATHRNWSFVSDASELGSEPDSWLELRSLRARMKIHVVGTRVSRDSGQPRHCHEVTSRLAEEDKTHKSRECVRGW